MNLRRDHFCEHLSEIKRLRILGSHFSLRRREKRLAFSSLHNG